MIHLFNGSPHLRIGRAACLVLILLPALSCDPVHSQRLKDARTAVARVDEQLKLANDALTAGNQSEADEHFARVRDRILRARDLYLQARADASEEPGLLREFANLCVRSEDFDLAAKAYRRAAKYDVENADHLFRAGQNFVRVGPAMTNEALESLTECLGRATEDGDLKLAARASAELGTLYHGLAMYEISREYYESAVASSPDDATAHIGIAGLNFRVGKVLEAANSADRLGQLAGEDAVFLDAMLRSGYDEFHDTRSYFADTAENHMAYAKLVTRLGRFREALFALERVVELDETNIIALNMLGSLAIQAGDTSRARDAFKRSLDINPDQPRTREVIDGLVNPSP